MSDLGLQILSAVNAPPALPPAVGLVATARLLGPAYLIEDNVERVDEAVNDSEGNPLDNPRTIEQRWEGGYRYLPEQTCAVGTYRDVCSDTQLTIPALGTSSDWVVGIPGLVETGDSCSVFGFEAHDYRGRAERALEAVESKMLAAEFWKGTVAQAEGWDNQWLASGFDTASGKVHWLNSVGGPVTPGAGLALLEEGIAAHSNGQPAAIHCTRQLGAALSELGNTFRSVNGLIYTYMGNVIIPDAGYDGSAPDGTVAGANQWAYATGLPVVRRSPIEVIPETMEEALDRSVNKVEFRALRYMTVSIPPCPLVAVQIALAIPS